MKYKKIVDKTAILIYLISMKEIQYENNTFGEWLKKERLENNFLTQFQLAEKAGISQQVVSWVENGNGISLETFEKIVNVLGYDIILRKK